MILGRCNFLFFRLLFTVFVAIRNNKVQNWARGASDVKKKGSRVKGQAQRKENIYHQNFKEKLTFPGSQSREEKPTVILSVDAM